MKEHFVKRQREPLETDLEEVTARDAGLCRQENYLTVLSENQNLKIEMQRLGQTGLSAVNSKWVLPDSKKIPRYTLLAFCKDKLEISGSFLY